MGDTYTASINVGPTLELTPVLDYLKFTIDTADYFLYLEALGGKQLPLELPYNKAATLGVKVRNDGDETIDIECFVIVDEAFWVLGGRKNNIAPGTSAPFTASLAAATEALAAGSHTIWWSIGVALPGGSIDTRPIEDSTTYTIATPATGDITKVQLNSAVLPEDGSLDWIRMAPATITVTFRNVGTVADYFTIAVKIVDAAGTILYDRSVTTMDTIPGDGAEYSITFPDEFTPTELTTKTLTTTITP